MSTILMQHYRQQRYVKLGCMPTVFIVSRDVSLWDFPFRLITLLWLDKRWCMTHVQWGTQSYEFEICMYLPQSRDTIYWNWRTWYFWFWWNDCRGTCPSRSTYFPFPSGPEQKIMDNYQENHLVKNEYRKLSSQTFEELKPLAGWDSSEDEDVSFPNEHGSIFHGPSGEKG